MATAANALAVIRAVWSLVSMTPEAEAFLVRADDVKPFDFHRLRIIDFTAGKGGGSSVAIIDIPADATHPLAYSRRSDKYYVVLAGEVRFRVSGDFYDLGAEDMLFIPKGTRFDYRARSEPSRLLLVHTPPFDPGAEIELEG